MVQQQPLPSILYLSFFYGAATTFASYSVFILLLWCSNKLCLLFCIYPSSMVQQQPLPSILYLSFFYALSSPGMPTPSCRQSARFQARQGRRGGWSTDRAQPSDRIFTGGRTGNTVVEQIRRQEVR